VGEWIRRSSASVYESPTQMPPAIWQVLASRGCRSTDDIDKLLHPKLKDLAHPFSLHDMQPAVDRLIKAFTDKEPILIYGDYDLDGTPGIALLLDGLSRLGFQNLYSYQPSRLKDGYGVHAARVRDFADKKIKVVLTVDVGITDVEAVDSLNADGIDVIITDHHLPKETLPKAVAIVNPNKGTCESHLQHLCGTGVAFYLILALRMEMTRRELITKDFNPKVLLDLFALATITDMVPLVRENRVLVKHGLQILAQTERPGLKRLFEELGLYRKTLRAQDIGFRVAPKLNALTRLDEGITAFQVLTASVDQARKLVDEALVINQRRSELQAKAKKIADDVALAQKNAPYIFVYSHEFHPGVVSLIANDLMNRYSVPAFVGAIHADGRMVGSARAPSKKFNLQSILGAAEAGLEKFGGHQLAAGFESHKSKAEMLNELLSVHFAAQNEAPAEHGFDSTFFDAEVSLADITPELMGWYEDLGPFGMQFEAPLFMASDLKVTSLKRLKGDYLKLGVQDGAYDFDALWFSKPKEFQSGSRIDLIFEPQWNEFQGRRTLQLLVHDARLTRRVGEGVLNATLI
jgi:single-stranded-DNA-specific exonuclease